MNDLEKTLGEELARVDRGLAAPTVDVAGLARAGRRERRRRTGLAAAAGAAAAVVATVGVLAVLPTPAGDRTGPAGPDLPTPSSLSDLPTGSPSDAPYVAGSVLHAGRASAPLGPAGTSTVHYAAGTTAALVEAGGTSRAVVAVDGGPFVDLGSEDASGAARPVSVLPSADGAYVAVATRTSPTRVEVSLHDVVGGGGLLGSHVFAVDEVGGTLSLVNVTMDARVVVSTDVYSVWAPGQQPVEVTGLGGTTVDQVSYPGGVAADVAEPGAPAVFGTIGADGRFEARGEVPASDVAWGPDGERWAQVPDADVLLVGRADGSSRPLALPTDGSWQVLGWETTTSVVLEDVGPDGVTEAEIRCDVVTPACERVPLD